MKINPIKSSLLSLILFIISFSTFSCSDDPGIIDKGPEDCEPSMTLLIPDSILTKHFHKTGSYWIYKNEVTGEIDSQWVDNHDESMFTFSNPPCEHVAISVTESKRFGWLSHRLESIPIFENDSVVNHLSYEVGITQKDAFTRSELRYTLLHGKYEPQDGYYSPWIRFKDSLKINDETYFKLTILKYDSFPINRDVYKEMTFSRNVGMVSFTDLHNDTWNLIDYLIK